MKAAAAVALSLALAFAVLHAGCARLEGQRRKPQPIPEPSEITKGLRNLFFSLKPEEVGVKSSDSRVKVYGLMMENGYDTGLASVVATRDGGASLYLGHGGGILGGIGYANVREASAAAVAEAEKHLAGMKKTGDFPYPALGRVRFYVHTFDGVLTAEADKEDLLKRRHKLWPLFYAGHEVLTQLIKANGGEAGKRVDGAAEGK